jgi:hypothetical protein
MQRALWLTAIAGLMGCATVENGGERMDVSDLLPSVQAAAQGDSVEFLLQVTNTTDSAVELVYPTGQSFDFVVSDSAGGEVWRWSADRMFTQAVREDELAPGETITHSVVWRAADQPRGEYSVLGTLTVADRTVQQRTEFTLR